MAVVIMGSTFERAASTLSVRACFACCCCAYRARALRSASFPGVLHVYTGINASTTEAVVQLLPKKCNCCICFCDCTTQFTELHCAHQLLFRTHRKARQHTRMRTLYILNSSARMRAQRCRCQALLATAAAAAVYKSTTYVLQLYVHGTSSHLYVQLAKACCTCVATRLTSVISHFTEQYTCVHSNCTSNHHSAAATAAIAAAAAPAAVTTADVAAAIS
eukprot:12425-Heterococcus_DN1.PRE.2